MTLSTISLRMLLSIKGKSMKTFCRVLIFSNQWIHTKEQSYVMHLKLRYSIKVTSSLEKVKLVTPSFSYPKELAMPPKTSEDPRHKSSNNTKEDNTLEKELS